MEEFVLAVVSFIVGYAEKLPWLATALAIIGGVYLALMLLQVPVLAAVKLTKTEKDDAFLAKMYDFLTDWGPCFAPVAAIFKKKAGLKETDIETAEPAYTELKTNGED